jgi:flagella basal body P-ring formation protein FlgA
MRMLAKRFLIIVLCWTLLVPAISHGLVKQPWNMDMKETAMVSGGIVRLADISLEPLPMGLGDLVIYSGGKPGTTKDISHKMILRKLVTEGLAGGIRFPGSKWSKITFTGAEATANTLRPQIRALIQPMVPSGIQGAPSSWFELELPATSFAFENDITLSSPHKKSLVPGRNTLRIRLHDGPSHQDFQVVVNLHVSGEIATALVEVPGGTCLKMEDFQWQWRDLAAIDSGIVVGRESLRACSSVKQIKPGHLLRKADLKTTPVILAGDRVDLCITRGSLEVVVKGEARQAGSLGQVIPVRNILNGRLVNATISGPGIVQWRN